MRRVITEIRNENLACLKAVPSIPASILISGDIIYQWKAALFQDSRIVRLVNLSTSNKVLLL